MIPVNYHSYLELYKKPNRVRVYLNGRYIFTIGNYENEVGFYVDFPRFNNVATHLGDYNFPKGQLQADSIAPSNSDLINVCPKLSFHQSGLVHLSKGGLFKKSIARKKIYNHIYECDGSHIFTITLQNLSLLEAEVPSSNSKTTFTNIPFDYPPKAIKFVGNLWKRDGLQKSLPNFSYLTSHTEMPIVWPRQDGTNVGDVIFITKFCFKNEEPLYLTVRCIPLEKPLDATYLGTLLTLISGFKFNEMKDAEQDASFFGFIAKK